MPKKGNSPNFKKEQKLWQQGYEFVVGLDEAGRGPLAGPVCAAAVCVLTQTAAAKFKNQNSKIKMTIQNSKLFKGIKDSKKLTAKQREQWYKILTTYPDIKWGIGIVSEKIIDKINILEATKLAMRRAIENLEEKFRREVSRGENSRRSRIDFLLLDGNFTLEDIFISQKAVVRGDEKVFSCAAASIIAKVTRDRLMIKYHKKFPQYGFDRHKGYCTKKHLKSIRKHGTCQIHRMSFHPCQAVKFRRCY